MVKTSLFRLSLAAALTLALGVQSAIAGEVRLAAGTVIPVRLETTVSSATSRPGDVVLAVVRSDVLHRGRVVIPAGSEVRGRVVSARRSGKVKGRAYLAVSFESVNIEGRDHPLSIRTLSAVAPSTAKKDAAVIGGGAGAGALVGALVDGREGARKGALIGGAAGTGVVLGTRGKEVTFPAGGRYRLRLARASVVEW